MCHSRLCLCVTWHPPCVLLCPNFSLLIKTPVIGLGPTFIQYDFTLIWFFFGKYPVRAQSQVLGLRAGTCLLGKQFNSQQSPSGRHLPIFRTQLNCVRNYGLNIIILNTCASLVPKLLFSTVVPASFLFACLFVFWPYHAACGILVPRPGPGIESTES